MVARLAHNQEAAGSNPAPAIMQKTNGQLSLDFMQRHRTADPATSTSAGLKIVRSGTAANHCQIILDCLRLHDGSTAKELARHLAGTLTESQVWKRMADLTQNGFVYRNAAIRREGSCTWWIKGC